MSDLISRQAVINAIANTCFWLSADNWEELTKCINSIPSVEKKAEIEKKCDRINSIASLLSYPRHREIQELLCEILTSIGNAESEGKEC